MTEAGNLIRPRRWQRGSAAAVVLAGLLLSGCGQSGEAASSCATTGELFLDGPGRTPGARTPLAAAKKWMEPGESADVTRRSSSEQWRSATVTLTDENGDWVARLRMSDNGHGWTVDHVIRCAR